jgi:hypothetical protein
VGGRLRFLAAIAAYSALFATTFLPGVVLVLIVVHVIALVLDVRRARRRDGEASTTAVAGRLAGRQLVAPALAALVTAYVWLPNVVALLNGGRELDAYGRSDLHTKDPLEVFGLLTPWHFFRWHDPRSYPAGLEGSRWTVYVGVVVVVVVLAALPRAGARTRVLLVATASMAALGALLHFGVPIVSWIALLPGLRPIGGVYWASFAAAALTIGFGLAIDVGRRHGLSLRVALGAMGVIVVAFAIGGLLSDAPAPSRFGIGLVLLALVAVVGVIWLRASGRAGGVLFAGALVVLVAVELLSYGNHTRPLRYDREQRPPEYLTFLRENVGDQRVLSAGRGAMTPEWGTAFGIRQIETLNLMQLPWYRDFSLAHVIHDERQEKFLEIGRVPEAIFSAEEGALDQLSVKYLLVDTRQESFNEQVAAQYPLVFEDSRAGVNVYENVDAFPRAYVSPAVTTTDERPTRNGWTTSATYTDDDELLEQARGLDVPATSTADGVPATIVEDRDTRVVIETDTADPGVLVLSDAYHSNWHVSVNGEDAHLARVNEAFRGVLVPAGRSTVVFEYRSAPRQLGAAVSTITVVGLLAGTAVSALLGRRRRVGRPQPTSVG